LSNSTRKLLPLCQNQLYSFGHFDRALSDRQTDGQADTVKGKCSSYSITELRVPELIPVLGSQPASDVSHKPGGRLPLLSARPAVTPATLERAAINFAAWQTEARSV